MSNPGTDTVRRFLARGALLGGQDVTAANSAAAAASALYHDLAQWVGHDGTHALYARALAQARQKHPALEQVKLSVRADPYLSGISKAIKAHGESASAAAIEAMLDLLFDLLKRLIGDDILTKLIDGSLPGREKQS